MIGVVFIARPAMVFGEAYGATVNVPAGATIIREEGPGMWPSRPVDETEVGRRSRGIVLALMSAVGGAGAFLAIRGIGHRASVLTTTNFFAGTCTLVTGLVFAISPFLPEGSSTVHLQFPKEPLQVLSLGAIIICGLLTQLLLTAGIGGETRSNRAPAMTYTGMLWTAAFDHVIFKQDMYWSSVIGCTLIVGGAVWMVLQPKAPDEGRSTEDVENSAGTRRNEFGASLELDSLDLSAIGGAPAANPPEGLASVA
ncbi:hypothetical protein BD289DRAFT_444934 [Coniella lustricola]|uniref:EamA domain-containing protein n=1 Tax=Coniella lustricola TaxID=2025994 RepID=A0A2T2ZVF8_9PEZI|nr:hypothetical protein BD289DRAFT_444934 [Coniella lustricola]